MGRKAEVLAGLGHVTEYYIAHHARFAEKNGDRTGLLIKRMEDGDPAPKCDPAWCPICTERKYDQWGMEIFSDEENMKPEA